VKIGKEKLIDFYWKMLKIRLFEERIADLYARGLVPGLAHLYIGQEAVAVGVCAALREDDYITSNHRGHGHVIAKGADVKPMMAELFGKKTGYCKGKGGSMHIADIDIGILGANGIAGGGLPIAVGAGLSCKLRGTDQVSVSFFGDGSSNNGTFHESLNLAAVQNLPVIFVCENNLYGISFSQKKHQKISDISIRATSYGIKGVTLDGNNVLEVYDAAYKAIRKARKKEGPTLLECKTYRWRGHHEGDPNQGTRYRSKEEIMKWKEKDPIAKFVDKLIGDNIISENELENMKVMIDNEIDQAVNFANESEFPADGELYENVYVMEGK